MQELFIAATPKTPEINFSPDKNLFRIKGNSSPEDVRAVYYPVIEWFRDYAAELAACSTPVYNVEKPLRFVIELDYFNSSSAKFLYDLLIQLKAIRDSGEPVRIEWIFQDGDYDLMDAGKDISEIAGIEFEYIEKNL